MKPRVRTFHRELAEWATEVRAQIAEKLGSIERGECHDLAAARAEIAGLHDVAGALEEAQFLAEADTSLNDIISLLGQQLDRMGRRAQVPVTSEYGAFFKARAEVSRGAALAYYDRLNAGR